MTKYDLPRVDEIEHSASSYPWCKSHFITSLQLNHYCKVAVLNHTIVGQGIMMTVHDEAHLLILSVDGQYQGKGVGKALLEQLIQAAQSQKTTTFFLELRVSNEAAFGLYLNQGFNEIGRRANYYPKKGRGKEDAILMAMDITPTIF